MSPLNRSTGGATQNLSISVRTIVQGQLLTRSLVLLRTYYSELVDSFNSELQPNDGKAFEFVSEQRYAEVGLNHLCLIIVVVW